MKRIEKLIEMGDKGSEEFLKQILKQRTENVLDPSDCGAILLSLNEEVPEPIILTPEQEKVVKWLIEGGYKGVRLSVEFIVANYGDRGEYPINMFEPPHFVHTALRNAKWLTTETTKLSDLIKEN